MKTLIVLIVTLIATIQISFGQAISFKRADSIRVDIEKKQVAAQLSQLSDSLTHSYAAMEASRETASASRRAKLEESMLELNSLRGTVELDSAEVASTSINSWNKESVDRIQRNTIFTRSEYARILSEQKKKNKKK